MAKKKKSAKESAAAAEANTSRAAIQRSFAKAGKEIGQLLRGPEALYRMPWFGMMGPPGCEKEAMLLDAQLPARPGSPQTFGLEGPDANYWWFFNEAVVLDFSATYFTGDTGGGGGKAAEEAPKGLKRLFKRKSAAVPSGGAWKAALDGLRTIRRLRPLDGMVLTIDAASLQVRTPDQSSALNRKAEALAARLHEAQQRLGVHFPVYLVVTGCETLQGFETFARALPDSLRDQMFGWSSPHEPDARYQPEYVDEAISSLHEAACVAQLELMPNARSQGERDGLYLLPRDLMGLRDPLKQFLDPIFRGASFRRGLPLRGIYLTARIAEKPQGADKPSPAGMAPGMAAAGPKAPVTRTPVFVRQLFTEKVFQEPGLARLDDEQSKALGKRVRKYRIALAVVFVTAALCLWAQRSMTGKRVDDFSGLISIMKAHQDKAKYGAVSDPARTQGVAALEALAALQTDGFEVWAAPSSYIENLTAEANSAIAVVLGDGVGRPLRDELIRRADLLLPPSLEAQLPDAKGIEGIAQQLAASLNGGSPPEKVAQIRAYADKVLEMHVNFERYANHDARDLGQVYLFLSGKDLTETLESQGGLFHASLRNIARWPTLPWDPYGKRAGIRLAQVTDQFQTQLFRQHPLRAALAELAELIDTIEARKGRESHYERLRTIYKAIIAVEDLIDKEQADWLLADDFNPGPRYAELVEILDGKAFPGVANPKLGGETEPAGKKFDADNQKLFSELRDAVWQQSSRLGRFRLLDRKDTRVVLSDKLVAVRDALKVFLDQPYVIEDESRFQLELARDTGIRDKWKSELLNTVLTWNKHFQAYLGATRPDVPVAISSALDAAARHEFRARVLQVIEFARPEVRPTNEGEGGAGWTAQRKDTLKTRIRNLADEYQSILKIVKVLAEVNQALNEAEDTRLFNHLRDDAMTQLNQVDQILEEEKLFTVRGDKFSWWEGDQPPGVVAFGARDANDLLARLAVQRKTVGALANEFARPLVEVMVQLGEPFSSDPDVEKWSKIIAVLTDYEKKVPGNSLEEMERFIEVDLNKLQLATCGTQLEPHMDRYNRDDFFKDRKYIIATTMARRCSEILKTVTLQGYVDLQQYFADRLAGRFPFAGPDVLAEIETGDIIEFYKRFDRYAGAFKALVNPKSDSPRALFGDATPEVVRFIEEMEQVRSLFAALVTAEDENPDLILDTEIEFRTNRDNEVNGNQIIEWWTQVGDQRIHHRDNKKSTQWRSNDQVGMCFRWAKDAMFLPAANQRAEHARVNGRGVCYVFTGRWALLRLLTMHAATPADRGRRSFLRPHTLRFETETSLASAARGQTTLMVTDTRVYARIGLMLPGGKAAFRLPEFPRRAPELTNEFLKSNGINAGVAGRGGAGGY